jgi:hypothetical protein
MIRDSQCKPCPNCRKKRFKHGKCMFCGWKPQERKPVLINYADENLPDGAGKRGGANAWLLA